MRLYGVIPWVMAFLQRQGRITYAALKYECDLDDATLDVVRQELIFARRVARDENGRVLVWTGGVQPALQAPTPAVHEGSATYTLPPLVTTPGTTSAESTMFPDVSSTPRDPGQASNVSEAERRQLTVMFCDLADSTQLSQRLDAEDLREVMRAYQQTAAEVVRQFEGYIAQYLGDGLLIYCGWPQAHEDDAQRAVYTGLGIVAAITETLNTRLQQDKGVQLAVRVGIHTGPVVVGEMGGGGRHENLATGETVNIAARLEGLASPNTVIISPTTERLVRDAFVLDHLGAHTLKGVAESMPVFRVVAPREVDHTVEETTSGDFAALVGRDEEIGLLLRRWQQSKEGAGQVVLISGAAGIGKSSLVEGLRAHVHQEGFTRITFRCSQYTRQSALYPVLEHLQHVLAWQRHDAAETKLAKLEQALQGTSLPLQEAVPLLAALLSLSLPEGRYPALPLTSQQQRQQTQDTLVAWLLEEAERRPVLAVWEDLHWADPSTQELLGLFIEQTPTVPMLHVLIFRPEFVPPWPTQSHMTPMTLNRLERRQIETLVTRLAGGKPLPAEVMQYIVAKTDGVPLYVVELTKMLLESALLHEDAEHYTLTGPLSEAAIPATLQDSLMARLDRLPTVREVAQLGAVLGREFAYDMLQALSAVAEPELQHGLSQLVDTELLYQRGRPPRAKYIFRHALIRDVAYQSLLRRTRQQYHQQVAQLLERRFPEVAEMQPELVAHHYTEAGIVVQAITYWQRAGQRASDRSANLEAISHFSTGLELLQTLAETPERMHQELALRIPLGAALLMTKGHGAAEVEGAYTRARELCQQLGDTPELFPVLFGLWRFYIVRPALHTTRELGEHLLRLAERSDDPPRYVVAHYALGFTAFGCGDFPAARSHLEAGIALYAPEQRRTPVFRIGQDPGVACLVYGAMTLWMLGYADQAAQRTREALALARQLGHPFSLGYVLVFAALVLQFRGEPQAVQELSQEAITLSTEHGFTLWLAVGTYMQSWGLAVQGQPEAALQPLHQSLARMHAIGVDLFRPYFLTLLAEVHGLMGHIEEAQRLLTEAQTLVEHTAECSWEAEVYRQQGVCLMAQSAPGYAAAESCFQRALEVARRQQARSLELRAAMSLSYLWQQQGKDQAARQLLAQVYNWFREGFDTPALQEASTLLEALEA